MSDLTDWEGAKRKAMMSRREEIIESIHARPDEYDAGVHELVAAYDHAERALAAAHKLIVDAVTLPEPGSPVAYGHFEDEHGTIRYVLPEALPNIPALRTQLAQTEQERDRARELLGKEGKAHHEARMRLRDDLTQAEQRVRAGRETIEAKLRGAKSAATAFTVVDLLDIDAALTPPPAEGSAAERETP